MGSRSPSAEELSSLPDERVDSGVSSASIARGSAYGHVCPSSRPRQPATSLSDASSARTPRYARTPVSPAGCLSRLRRSVGSGCNTGGAPLHHPLERREVWMNGPEAFRSRISVPSSVGRRLSVRLSLPCHLPFLYYLARRGYHCDETSLAQSSGLLKRGEVLDRCRTLVPKSADDASSTK
jgi:hypothetical protein